MNPYFSLPQISDSIGEYHHDCLDKFLAGTQCKQSVSRYVLREIGKEEFGLSDSIAESLVSAGRVSLGLAYLETAVTSAHGRLFDISKKTMAIKKPKKFSRLVDSKLCTLSAILRDLLAHTSLMNFENTYSVLNGKQVTAKDISGLIDCSITARIHRVESRKIYRGYELWLDYRLQNKLAIISNRPNLVDLSSVYEVVKHNYGLRQFMGQTLYLIGSVYGISLMPDEYGQTGMFIEGYQEYAEAKERFKTDDIPKLVEYIIEDEEFINASYALSEIKDDREYLESFLEKCAFMHSVENDGAFKLPEGFYKDVRLSAGVILTNATDLKVNNRLEAEVYSQFKRILIPELLKIQKQGDAMIELHQNFCVRGDNGSLNEMFLVQLDSNDLAYDTAEDIYNGMMHTGSYGVDILDRAVDAEALKIFENRIDQIGDCVHLFSLLGEMNNLIGRERFN